MVFLAQNASTTQDTCRHTRFYQPKILDFARVSAALQQRSRDVGRPLGIRTGWTLGVSHGSALLAADAQSTRRRRHRHTCGFYFLADGWMPIRARRSQNRMHSFMGGRLADGHEAASAAGKAGGSGPGSPLHVGQLPEDHVAGLGKLRAQDQGLTTQRARIRRGWVIQRRPGHFCLRGISAGLLLNCFRDGARLPEARLRCIIGTAPDRRVSRRNNGHGFRPNRDLSYFFSCLHAPTTRRPGRLCCC